jgi:hypothetical protein
MILPTIEWKGVDWFVDVEQLVLRGVQAPDVHVELGTLTEDELCELATLLWERMEELEDACGVLEALAAKGSGETNNEGGWHVGSNEQ